MNKSLVALAGVLAWGTATSANAAATVTFGTTHAIPNPANDFAAQLNALGLYNYATTGANIVLDQASTITFYFLGSESAFNDKFATAGGLPISYTEHSSIEDHFAAPVLLGSDNFSAGTLINYLNFSSSGGANATVGQDGFGIFLGRGAQSGFSTNVFYFGYDDQITNQDDNHDDFIIKAVIAAVPEPATWAMMLVGFGAMGMSVRRRRNQPLPQIA